jgi:hypothetical protein
MKRTFTRFISAFSLLLTAACTGYAPNNRLVGQNRAAVIAELGIPEREYPSGEFSKLHFPRGSAGSHTYFVYLDKEDKLSRWEQVLTEDRFDSIRAGMSLDQVIDAVGITRIRTQLAGDRGYVWYYRYQNTQCRSFVIEFTRDYIVRGTLYIHRSGRRCNYVGP